MKKWWLEKPMRFIQTNLREIDADLDINKYIDYLKAFATDAVLFNVGGIVANYPTDLEYHYKNPHLQNDFVGEVIKRTQAEGIRFIGRFDFSKVNEIYTKEHPEWQYKSAKGEFVNYNGQVHVCINSYYQQEYALKILDEVIERYPIDGVFFNMIGYQTRDYSGNYHGICQCDNCQRRFGEYAGHPVPKNEDKDDPIFLRYQIFRQETTQEQFQRISDFVKGKNDQIALCTYASRGIDVFRKESNTAVDRPLPEWNYSASDNVKSVLSVWEDKVIANSAVHFVDIPYRHSGVSPHLTFLRMAENIANAAWLDYYVIGPLERQDDRVCFEGVKEIYQYYQANERYYTGVKPVADVCLIRSHVNDIFGSVEEFRGIFRMLSEAHVLFDVIPDSALEEPAVAERLQTYQMVILPEVRIVSETVRGLLDAYVAAGGTLLMTGLSAMYNADGQLLEKSTLVSSGIVKITGLIEPARGSYYRIREQDKTVLRGFENLDILYRDGEAVDCAIPENGRGFLGYIPAYMFGPPEKCYYTEESDIPGIIVHPYEKGQCITIPWDIGKHYQRLGNHGQSMLFQSVLNDLAKFRPSLKVESSPLVEVCSQIRKDGAWQLISLVNHSGQNGTAFLPPLEIRDIHIRVSVSEPVNTVHVLRMNSQLEFTQTTGELTCVLPSLKLFETIVLEYQIA